ncbi:CoA transferase [Bacteroidia bacterium]|nr:CoA transferase [Bacteroidia bacterium]
MTYEQRKGVLSDLLVLDLTRVVAGPYCGAMLGDFGALVIKIETPKGGDDARNYAPHINGESVYYANLNRNKQGITLNLKSEQGKAIFKKLAEKADVVIENYRPGVMNRLGLSYEDVLRPLNKRLIYAAVSGFGSYGRDSDKPGYDIISQAAGGLMSITGEKGGEPTRSGNAMGDILGGTNLCIGILAALHAREKTGNGQRVDVSLVDSVVASLENAYARYFYDGKIPARNGNAYASIAPYDSYRAKDGYVVIACGNQKLYERLCVEFLNQPELITDERFLTIPLRVEHNEELKVHIEEKTKSLSIDEAVSMILALGIPASPINDLSRIVSDAHIAKDRKMFVEIEHPVIGKWKVNGNPVKLMDAMPEITHPAPTLGQHNSKILGEFADIDAKEIEELKNVGVL